MEHAGEIDLRLGKFAWRQSSQGATLGDHMSLIIVAGGDRSCRPVYSVSLAHLLAQTLHTDDTSEHLWTDSHMPPE